MRLFLLFFSAWFLIYPSRSPSAQTTKRIRVIFSCTCDDNVGAQLASAFRDRLATSPRYIEAEDSKENRDLYATISAVSMEDGQLATAISIVFSWHGIILDQRVQVCGQSKVTECAESDFANLDSDLHP